MLNLLFTVNDKVIDQLRWCLESILRFDDEYGIYIIHSGLSDSTQRVLGQFVEGRRARLHFIAIDPSLFDGFPETERYPREIYYRLLAADYLPKELDRILYLDADTMALKPLDELYRTDFEGNYYAACTHIRKTMTKINEVRLGIEEETVYVNTGVLLMNLALLRTQNTREKMMEIVRTRKLFLPDQDIITVLYGSAIRLIDYRIYNLSDRMIVLNNCQIGTETITRDWVREHTVILHFCGRNKPWRKEYIGLLGSFFYELHGFDGPRVDADSFRGKTQALIQRHFDDR